MITRDGLRRPVSGESSAGQLESSQGYETAKVVPNVVYHAGWLWIRLVGRLQVKIVLEVVDVHRLCIIQKSCGCLRKETSGDELIDRRPRRGIEIASKDYWQDR